MNVVAPSSNNAESAKFPVLVSYTPAVSGNKLRFRAGKLHSYSGSEINVDLGGYGVHAFSRSSGEWLEGDCTNFVQGRIYQFEELERAIQQGIAYDVFEAAVMEPPVVYKTATAGVEVAQ